MFPAIRLATRGRLPRKAIAFLHDWHGEGCESSGLREQEISLETFAWPIDARKSGKLARTIDARDAPHPAHRVHRFFVELLNETPLLESVLDLRLIPL